MSRLQSFAGTIKERSNRPTTRRLWMMDNWATTLQEEVFSFVPLPSSSCTTPYVHFGKDRRTSHYKEAKHRSFCFCINSVMLFIVDLRLPDHMGTKFARTLPQAPRPHCGPPLKRQVCCPQSSDFLQTVPLHVNCEISVHDTTRENSSSCRKF